MELATLSFNSHKHLNQPKVKEAARRFLPRFLDAEVSMTAVTCGPGEVPAMAEFMNDIGFKMKIVEDIEDSVMSN